MKSSPSSGSRPREHLDADEREREHVGPRAGRAVRARELLGRAVRRGERGHLPARLRERAPPSSARLGRPSRSRSRGASPWPTRERGSPRTKMFAGFTSRWAIPFACASASASAAGSRRRIVSATVRGGRPALLLLREDRPRAWPPRATRAPCTGPAPLSSVVSIPTSRACTIAAERSERSARSAPSRMNSSRSLPAVLGPDVAERLEDLHGDGALPEEVRRPVDDREAPLPDDALDRVLVRDRRSDELESVRERTCARGKRHTPGAALPRSPRGLAPSA